MILNGTKIQASPNVSDYQNVKRTWRERLFTLPWKPHHPFKVVFSPSMYTVGDTILVSVETYAVLEREKAKLDELMKETPK